jgi:hypothetical protein
MDPSKKPATPPPTDWEHEGLEFELTDFGEAKRILDDESISQFHVETSISPAQWKRMRRATLPTDRALSGQAIDWLIGLEASLRPQQLSAQFPRIVNMLAAVWNYPEERQAALDKLLNSERKGRTGFPPLVIRELAALRDSMIALRGWDEPF